MVDIEDLGDGYELYHSEIAFGFVCDVSNIEVSKIDSKGMCFEMAEHDKGAQVFGTFEFTKDNILVVKALIRYIKEAVDIFEKDLNTQQEGVE